MENYYFVETRMIYYTRLDEIYRSPSSDKGIEPLFRTFQEGKIIDGKIIERQFHYDDKFKRDPENTDRPENMYKSLEELNGVFDAL